MSPRPRVLLLAADGAAYAEALQTSGFDVRAVAPIRFEPTDVDAAREALAAPERWAGLALTSPRAVEAVGAEAFSDWAGDVWAVGSATAAAARRCGLRVRGAASGSARALATAIVAASPDPARPFLFFCGDRRRDDLPEVLRDAGYDVAPHVVYRTLLAPSPLLPEGERCEWALFFSPSGVEAAVADPAFPWDIRLGALGPTTAEALRAAGHRPAVVAPEPTPAALAHALLAHA